MDAFLIKYNTSGSMIWAKQFGTFLREATKGFALDLSGNIYVTGSIMNTTANVPLNSTDFFIYKFDTEGNIHN